MKEIQPIRVKGRREKQKAETNALILKIAKNLFEELGFEKTTMRKVAAEAEISPGAIFKHFENKSALLAAALFNDIEVIQEDTLKRIPQGEPVNRQFLFIAKQFYTYYAMKPALSKMLVEHSVFIEGEWGQKFKTQSYRLIHKVAQLIDEAKKKKQIKNDTDNELLALSFFSHYLYVLITYVKKPVFDPVSAVNMLEPLINQSSSGAVRKN